MFKIIVFISGNGTNLQAIIDACKFNIIDAQISHVISDNPNARGLDKAVKSVIGCTVFEKNKNMTITEYDMKLVNFVNSIDHDLLILAGFMHILSSTFIDNIKTPIINLHPALPNKFPGKNAITQAFNAYKKGIIDKTVVMIHRVVKEVDAGEVIEFEEVPIYDYDTLETLTRRIQYFEKYVLIKSIQKLTKSNKLNDSSLIYSGKVRNVYDIGHNLLLFEHTNRQSAFDRYICNIPNKGNILTKTSKWWFKNTYHIVDNHFIYSDDGYMICKKCIPFKIEVVVRGYITGSTSTSLWTHYKRGDRTYCGIELPDGLIKNQKLDENIVTPTTKGIIDHPISGTEIINEKYMTSDEWIFIKNKASELFEYGQYVSNKKNLILVDTKYEFGKDFQNNIILIDEIHTCDSSRYWIKDSYQERFNNGIDPESLDKDIIRSYIESKCNPYTDDLPTIPNELIKKTKHAYEKFCKIITDEDMSFTSNNIEQVVSYYFDNVHDKLAVIMAGSESDRQWINKIKKELLKHNILSKTYIASVHKNTQVVLDIINSYNQCTRKIVFIAVAGMSNALGGILAANLKFPVISCPHIEDNVTMTIDIYSSNPSDVPSMLVLSPENTAIAVKKIFDLHANDKH
jgi:formyltetrahydrofolate-dependent phosphoribosylglycinamide formyltransferase/phosphoribosylaminoimidazole-succinocarboxamide synthase